MVLVSLRFGYESYPKFLTNQRVYCECCTVFHQPVLRKFHQIYSKDLLGPQYSTEYAPHNLISFSVSYKKLLVLVTYHAFAHCQKRKL